MELPSAISRKLNAYPPLHGCNGKIRITQYWPSTTPEIALPCTPICKHACIPTTPDQLQTVVPSTNTKPITHTQKPCLLGAEAHPGMLDGEGSPSPTHGPAASILHMQTAPLIQPDTNNHMHPYMRLMHYIPMDMAQIQKNKLQRPTQVDPPPGLTHILHLN